MKSASISDYSLLQAFDDQIGSVCYAGRQKWYSSFIKRFSGCAPTAFSSLVWYFHQKKRELPATPEHSKAGIKQLMEDIWSYITPAFRGVPSATFFAKGASKYLTEKELGIRTVELVIPPPSGARPEFSEVISFLEDALSNDFPVAFLCLDSGAEKKLDSWHWTVLLSVEYAEDFRSAHAEIVDDGKLIRIDLYNWFSSTKREGGFVGLVPL